MSAVWKFGLALEDLQTVVMPAGAELLTVQTQHGVPQLWARVQPGRPKESRQIATFGTGHDMGDQPMKYLGSYQLSGGDLVFHVFEVLQ